MVSWGEGILSVAPDLGSSFVIAGPSSCLSLLESILILSRGSKTDIFPPISDTPLGVSHDSILNGAVLKRLAENDLWSTLLSDGGTADICTDAALRPWSFRFVVFWFGILG